MNSVYFINIGLFKFSISSWVSFGNLCLSRNLSISPGLSNLLVQSCSYYSLIVLLMYEGSILMSPLSFLI